MGPYRSELVFLDQHANKLVKTIDLLKTSFKEVKVFTHDSELFEYLENYGADIVFINLDIQPNDGIALLKELVSKTPAEAPPYKIIYSDKQDDFLQELAFASGADGFISYQNKPLVMKLYVQNLLRRRNLQYHPIHSDALHIDTERYLVFQDGKAHQLPRKEFQLLELLYMNAGKFFSKPEIAGLLWNDDSIANKRIIDVHIYNIRQHFGRKIIDSQKGKGYRLVKALNPD